jgi:hypothetical protein
MSADMSYSPSSWSGTGCQTGNAQHPALVITIARHPSLRCALGGNRSSVLPQPPARARGFARGVAKRCLPHDALRGDRFFRVTDGSCNRRESLCGAWAGAGDDIEPSEAGGLKHDRSCPDRGPLRRCTYRRQRPILECPLLYTHAAEDCPAFTSCRVRALWSGGWLEP